MVQELHTQDTVPVENKLTPEQEDTLWWEHYEKTILLHIEEDGILRF